MPPVAVVGRGRLGNTLIAALERVGRRVLVHSAQSPGTGGQLRVSGAATIFLTVPDSALVTVARSLEIQPGQSVVHCSGALGREQLVVAAERGATTGCFHPLQTFPSKRPEPERFQGIAIGIEAPGALGEALEQLANDLGGHPFRMEGVDRALYHAAAVVASNHLVALASAATRLWAAAGLPAESGRTALAPLITAATHNVGSMELADALTGPVARGDVDTVARHLAALEAIPDLRELYRRLSLELLRLPLELDPARAAEFEHLLGGNMADGDP